MKLWQASDPMKGDRLSQPVPLDAFVVLSLSTTRRPQSAQWLDGVEAGVSGGWLASHVRGELVIGMSATLELSIDAEIGEIAGFRMPSRASQAALRSSRDRSCAGPGAR